MTIDPQPQYLTDPNQLIREMGEVRRALGTAVDEAVAAAVRDAAVAYGATIAPAEAQSTAPNRVTLDVPRLGRLDVHVGHAIIEATVPPGWDTPPRHGVGSVLPGRVIGQPTVEVVVIGVLGDRDDPRPGYRLAVIGRDAQSRLDPTSVRGAVVIAPSLIDDLRSIDTVTLPW